MIFAFNGNGNLISVTPSQVYQGSNRASTIYLVMPIAPYTTVEVAFILPNGNITSKFPMALATEWGGLLGFTDENGNLLCVWSLDLPSIITMYAGTVTAQFFISGTGISTYAPTFTVLEGVPPITSDGETISPDYEGLLNFVQQQTETIGNNLNYVNNTSWKLDPTKVYNTTVAKTVGSYVVTSSSLGFPLVDGVSRGIVYIIYDASNGIYTQVYFSYLDSRLYFRYASEITNYGGWTSLASSTQLEEIQEQINNIIASGGGSGGGGGGTVVTVDGVAQTTWNSDVKQNADNNTGLETTSKNIVGAINEVKNEIQTVIDEITALLSSVNG